MSAFIRLDPTLYFLLLLLNFCQNTKCVWRAIILVFRTNNTEYVWLTLAQVQLQEKRYNRKYIACIISLVGKFGKKGNCFLRRLNSSLYIHCNTQFFHGWYFVAFLSPILSKISNIQQSRLVHRCRFHCSTERERGRKLYYFLFCLHFFSGLGHHFTTTRTPCYSNRGKIHPFNF